MATEYAITACMGKAAYASALLARKVLARRELSGRDKGVGKLSVYRCRTCGHWHIGSALRWRAR